LAPFTPSSAVPNCPALRNVDDVVRIYCYGSNKTKTPNAFLTTLRENDNTLSIPTIPLISGRSRVHFLMMSLDFSVDLILPASLRPWGRLGL
jgi:hypothetical protein